MKKQEILEKYGEEKVEINIRAGNAQWNVKPRTVKTISTTVKGAMDCWSGTHWTAISNNCIIRFDEDYGHELEVKK